MSITYESSLTPELVACLEEARLPLGVVVRRNNNGKWVGIRDAVNEKLEHLGPFATRPAQLCIQFIGNDTGRYMIEYDKQQKLAIFESLGILSTGSHGPFTKVTLEGAAKAAANIPAEATHFCFCYPPTGVATLSNQAKQNLEAPVGSGDPEFTFLTFGGFAYFDCGVEYTKFLRTNALVQGETGITFEGPFPWKSEYTQCLYRQGRFEPITISALSEKGLQLYCFINPNEEVTNGSRTWTPCPNGGFVYLYNADGSPHPMDCYFSVASEAKPAESNELRITPFSVIEKFKTGNTGTMEETRAYCCVVCYTNAIRCVLLPCKHLCICAECSETLKKRTSAFVCPMCREHVTDIWDVYLSGAQ